MPVILVVEPEKSVVDRITGALAATGWQVRAVPTVSAALEFTAGEAPLLFLVSIAVEGATDLLDPFARRRGGPGTVALIPTGSNSGAGLHADEVVEVPFADEQLRAAVDRTLRGATQRVMPRSADEAPKLTSQDIFGDLVADLDDAVRTVEPTPGPPPPRAPRSASDARIDRKLEETLSGILGIASPVKPTPPPPPPQPPPEPPRRTAGGDVDALLSRTLSGLDLPVARKPVPPPSAPVVTPPPAVPPPAAPTLPRRPVELDFSMLEELTRGGRRSPTVAPPAAPAPPVAPPVAPPTLPTERLVEAVDSGTFEAWELTPPGLKPAGVPPPIQPVQPAPVVAAPVEPTPPAPPPPVAEPTSPSRGQIAAGQRFGQYLLLEKIGMGGMAEVWKARSQGVEGFQKTVAIKRILQHLTDSADFVNMFVDEAKLAAQLNHDNIIQIFDLGKIGDDYYMAMEYVEGENLRGILNKSRERGEPMPAAIALMIAVRLASALGYAHRKRDFEGQELGLVHRDVSPQNVLVSYEGNVKLCDFGIVKAVAKTGHTQMGALKGKLQYMSPEQAWGRPVDQRSDLFSVGVLLFEMLTGRRLFTGDSEMQLLEAVRDCRVQAVSEANPDIPVAVDIVVAKALGRDPAERYQTADELIQALQGLLARMQPHQPAVRDVASYMRALFRGGAEPELPSFPLEPAPTLGFVPPLIAAAAKAPPVAEPAPQPPPAIPPAIPVASPEPEPHSPLEPTFEFDDLAPEPELDPEPVVGRESYASYLPEPAPLLPPVELVPEPNATIALPVARRMAETMPVPIRPAPPEVMDVAPVPPLAGVALDENPQGRNWLFLAIVAALILGGAVAWYLTRHPGTPEVTPPALDAPADAVPSLPSEVTPTEPQAGPAGEEAPSHDGAPTSDLNLDQAVEQRSAEKEAELRRQFEAERKRIQQEIEAANRGAPGAAGAAPLTPPKGLPETAPVTETPAPEPPPVTEPSSPTPVESPPPTPLPQPTPSPPAAVPEAPSVKLGELVSMGPGVTPPQLVTFTKPQYPPLARKLRVTGEVVVSLLVDENGEVREVRLQKGVTQNVGINEAALEAARTARYRPATKASVRVKMWATLKIPFQL